ncbi:DNA translocase FtsK-like [Tribolium madens]|uniref:DNA translocase FtsK-like n=1 Tax=Tribolium madens TaxID=41895 RepID=UPI001CF71D53|nr:DNA translocase FtsK-like [Tribolium madens]
MNRIFVFAVFLGAVFGQGYHGDPQTAAILNEQRYLSGDGKFGAQYSQEDGVQFKEESDADGTRRGTYSYVDPNGQRHTVSYTAGKHGFQATGDGIPQPLPTTLPVAPQPQYQPLPQYNPPEYRDQYQPQYRPQPQYQPQPQPQQYQQPQYTPQQYQQPQYRPQPQPVYTTTPAPHRFYPPGKLSLNRSPDGFSYSFQKA